MNRPSSLRWSANEVRALVAEYLEMLDATLRGDRVNKAERWRALMARLAGRSRPSIEMKHQNVSALMVEFDLDYLDGYVPLRNYERTILPDIVKEALVARPELLELMRSEAARGIPSKREVFRDQSLRKVEAPRPKDRGRERPKGGESVVVAPRNWASVAEVEARNRDLGRAGEESVLDFERRRLHDGGRADLAERVQHVAVEVGDGLGYDIASFELTGVPRLVEVKTTRRAAMAPFFVSPNELAVSKRESESYHLYRVFRFDIERSVYILRGDLAGVCRLEPTEYRARIA